MRLNRLEVLTQEEIRKIHAASLDILENCGMKIFSDKVLKILEEGGCIVDYDSKVCKFPAELVERCIDLAPSQFRLYDRDGNNPITIGDGVPKCASGHNGVFYIDPQTLERRYATVQDVAEFGIVSEATMFFKAVIIAVIIVLQSEPVRNWSAKRSKAKAMAKGGALNV